MLKSLKIESLLDLTKTIAAPLFEGKTYPYEVLPQIGSYIKELGKTLNPEKFTALEGDIYIAKSAKVAPSALINGPCIIDEDAQIRHCAFIRGNAVVGKGAVVGNSTELKNCILFDKVQVPHYNYVGDAVLGFKAHMGAGAVTANVKADNSNVTIRGLEGNLETGLRKVGAVLGDYADVGCNSVLTPGVVIGKGTNVYPTSMVRGEVPANSIYKEKGKIVPKIKK